MRRRGAPAPPEADGPDVISWILRKTTPNVIRRARRRGGSAQGARTTAVERIRNSLAKMAKGGSPVMASPPIVRALASAGVRSPI